MRNLTTSDRLTLLGIGFLALLAVVMVLVMTPWGVEVGHDSVIYISTARGLLSGQGLIWVSSDGVVKAPGHFPPLYPSLLALFGWIGVDIVSGARILAAVFFGLNVLLAGMLITRATASGGWALLAALLTLSSPIILRQHLRAMSEPAFITFMLLWLMSLNAYLKTPTRVRFLAVCTAASAALLTRYIGISLVAASALAMLILSKGGWRARLLRALSAAALGYLPVLPWYFRNWRLTGNLTNRVILFHPPTVSKLKLGIVASSSWLLPEQSNLWVRLGLLTAVGMIALGLHMRIRRRIRHVHVTDQQNAAIALQTLVLVSSLCYLGALIVSLTFFDAATRIDNRLLSPVYLLAILYLTVTLWLSQVHFRWGRIPIMMIGIGVSGFITINAMRSAAIGKQMMTDGAGFTARRWQQSKAVQLVSELPEALHVYTNEMLGLSFLAERPVYAVPEKIDPVKAKVRPEFLEALAEAREDLLQGDAILVIFPPLSKRPEMPSLEEVAEGLVLWRETGDAQIYAAPGFNPLY